jgi:hypothetical protein
MLFEKAEMGEDEMLVNSYKVCDKAPDNNLTFYPHGNPPIIGGQPYLYFRFFTFLENTTDMLNFRLDQKGIIPDAINFY